MLLYSKDLLLLCWALTAITQLLPPLLWHKPVPIFLFTISVLKCLPCEELASKTRSSSLLLMPQPTHTSCLSPSSSTHHPRVLCQIQGRKTTSWLCLVCKACNHWTQSADGWCWQGCRPFTKLCKKSLIRSTGVLEIFCSHPLL